MTILSIHTNKMASEDSLISALLKNQLYEEKAINDVTLSSCTLDNLEFRNCRLEEFDTKYIKIRDTRFEATHLNECLFSAGKWRGIEAVELTANDCSFIFMDLDDIKFSSDTIFTNTLFKDTVISNCIFEDGVRFENCTFEKAQFVNCTFRGTYSAVRPQLCTKTVFKDCTLTESRFEECNFKPRELRCGTQMHAPFVKNSVTFDKCSMKGTLFTYLTLSSLKGLDKLGSADCVFDLIENDKRYGSQAAMSSTSKKTDDRDSMEEELDEYDEGCYTEGMYYTGWESYNARRNHSVYRPTKPIKTDFRAYRFFTPGLCSNA
jgi:uncharacterized protein YjbI with pentapeptide repeats